MRPDEFFSLFRPEYQPDPPIFLQSQLVMECMFWIFALLLAFLLLKTHPKWILRLEAAGKSIARRQGLTVLAIILSSLTLRIAVLPLIPIPDPIVHDEFSYLLQAKTFASGRITNPTPAGWTHFETFHVNMRPTYQSMYPPGQALFMAGAEVLHARPWWGVWFSIGLMCGAICWMLQGWMPPQWALLGGCFCVIRFSTFSYWNESYFGGALAAAGGALVLGSFARIKKTRHLKYGITFALGLGLLANTRAYEGFVFSVPALIAIVYWIFFKREVIVRKISVLVPGMALLALIFIAMGYYNFRNTGHPLLMPYVINQQQYHITKPFIWQARYPIPNYRHSMMQTFYVIHELPDYLNRSHPGYYSDLFGERLQVYYNFFIWPLLAVAIIGLWCMFRSRKMRLIPCTFIFMLAGLLVEQWQPESHYGAPALCIAIATILYGLRIIWQAKLKNKPYGAMLVRSIVICVFLWSLLPLADTAMDPYGMNQKIWTRGPMHSIWIPSSLERARLQAQLEQQPGNHIVFVHFKYHEIPGIFWIYNDPDITHSKIIWAYDMGMDANQELIRLYPNRHIWWVDKTNGIMPLVPYQPSQEVSDFILAQYRAEVTRGQ